MFLQYAEQGNTMSNKKAGERGFTLIEVIFTLVLVAITAVLAGMWIVNIAEGYIFAKTNMNNLQKGHLAMARLEKEFIGITSVDPANTNATQITFTRSSRPVAGSFAMVSVAGIISWDGSNILVNNDNAGNSILSDNVTSFAFRCYNDDFDTPGYTTTWTSASRIIEVSFTLKGPENTPITLVKRIAPRSL
jgi:prepilin-type N-terminal cleavage/methylation domain-containing protein